MEEEDYREVVKLAQNRETVENLKRKRDWKR